MVLINGFLMMCGMSEHEHVYSLRRCEYVILQYGHTPFNTNSEKQED